MGPHDQAFKKLLKEEGAAEALLRERLPKELVARFSGPPEHLSESFVDEALRGSLADVVLRVPLTGGDDAFVFCLIEHKRTEGPRVLVQVLRYLTALYAQLARTRAPGLLPAVVPLLVYNGNAPWRGPRRFSKLLDSPTPVKRLTVDFEVVLVDLNAEPVSRLSSNPTLNGGLLGLKAAATPLPKLEGVLKKMLQALSRDPSTKRLFLNYLSRVRGRNTLSILRRAERAQKKGPEATMQTIRQYFLSQGKRQGLRKGLEQGLEQGLEKGRIMLRDNLRRLLTKRFKRLTLSAEKKLAAADADTLNRWFETAWTAKSLKAVFD